MLQAKIIRTSSLCLTSPTAAPSRPGGPSAGCPPPASCRCAPGAVHRMDRHAQDLGDLRVRLPRAHPVHHLSFARRQAQAAQSLGGHLNGLLPHEQKVAPSKASAQRHQHPAILLLQSLRHTPPSSSADPAHLSVIPHRPRPPTPGGYFADPRHLSNRPQGGTEGMTKPKSRAAKTQSPMIPCH